MTARPNTHPEDQDAIRAQLDLARGQLALDQPPPTVVWLTAQIDTLEWLLGTRELSPLTGGVGGPTRRSIEIELNAAVLGVYDRDVSNEDVYRNRALGVERVLRWELNLDEAPMAWVGRRRAS